MKRYFESIIHRQIEKAGRKCVPLFIYLYIFVSVQPHKTSLYPFNQQIIFVFYPTARNIGFQRQCVRYTINCVFLFCANDKNNRHFTPKIQDNHSHMTSAVSPKPTRITRRRGNITSNIARIIARCSLRVTSLFWRLCLGVFSLF